MGASFVRADLEAAHLRDADLYRADLSGAVLRGADLTGADLREAILNNARYDRHTRWPKGFDPVKAGAVKMQ